jgi:polar amino acid transport system substrate-binding protein
VPGLVAFPTGDDCLQCNEMATGHGLAVDKNDTVCSDWLQAVNDDVKDKVTAAESDLLKGT